MLRPVHYTITLHSTHDIFPAWQSPTFSLKRLSKTCNMRVNTVNTAMLANLRILRISPQA